MPQSWQLARWQKRIPLIVSFVACPHVLISTAMQDMRAASRAEGTPAMTAEQKSQLEQVVRGAAAKGAYPVLAALVGIICIVLAFWFFGDQVRTTQAVIDAPERIRQLTRQHYELAAKVSRLRQDMRDARRDRDEYKQRLNQIEQFFPRQPDLTRFRFKGE